MQKVAITFGGPLPKYIEASKRFKNQLESLKIYDKVIAYSHEDLQNDKKFWNTHGNFITQHNRGYGYWLWKSYLISKTLSNMQDNDILFYADAGCEVNEEKKEITETLIKELQSDNNYCIYMCLNDSIHKEEQYTKFETLKEFNCQNTAIVLKRTQLIGGLLMIKVNDKSKKIMQDWFDYSTKNDYCLLNDSLSSQQERRKFKNHRHDQSIISLMAKTIYSKDINYRSNIKNTVYILRTRSGQSKLNTNGS